MIAIDQVLAPGASLREVEPGLLSVLEPEDEGAPYDARAAVYDRAVASRLYSELAWGLDPARHEAFIERALGSKTDGWALDVAAGSCVASAAAYASCSRPLIVLDRSLGMLRRGRDRLAGLLGSAPPNIIFLQADAAALPLCEGSVGTVVCHGAFHVFSEPHAVSGEWARVLAPGGSLFVSSLIRGRWLGDRYLGLLHRAGEITEPRSASEFAAAVRSRFAGASDLETVGNFAYLSFPEAASP